MCGLEVARAQGVEDVDHRVRVSQMTRGGKGLGLDEEEVTLKGSKREPTLLSIRPSTLVSLRGSRFERLVFSISWGTQAHQSLWVKQARAGSGLTGSRCTALPAY
jgi:hypothetical protein